MSEQPAADSGEADAARFGFEKLSAADLAAIIEAAKMPGGADAIHAKRSTCSY